MYRLRSNISNDRKYQRIFKLHTNEKPVDKCFLCREAQLVKITDENQLGEVIHTVSMFNYIKNDPFKFRMFQIFYKEMGADYKVWLFHSKICWISKGRILNRF